ncbi:hypothetical protein CRYUN_Cryun30bG0049300 [Craigia yunnanensis]
MAKLSSLDGRDSEFCFKYRLPGKDLDALISITNDEDLEHMMLEYDRLHRGSTKLNLDGSLLPAMTVSATNLDILFSLNKVKLPDSVPAPVEAVVQKVVAKDVTAGLCES